MKVRLLLSLATGGLMLASLMSLTTTQAHAGCNGPNDPNPCPPKEEGKDKETQPRAPVSPTDTPLPPSPTQPLPLTTDTPNAAVVLPLPPSGSSDDAGQVPPPDQGDRIKSTPAVQLWNLGSPLGILIGLLVGILIGMLLPAVSKGFFDRGGGAAGVVTPTDNHISGMARGGGGENAVVVQGGLQPGMTEAVVVQGGLQPGAALDMKAPGPPQSHATIPDSPDISPRDAALNIREAALNAREAALSAREAALGASGSPAASL